MKNLQNKETFGETEFNESFGKQNLTIDLKRGFTLGKNKKSNVNNLNKLNLAEEKKAHQEKNNLEKQKINRKERNSNEKNKVSDPKTRKLDLKNQNLENKKKKFQEIQMKQKKETHTQREKKIIAAKKIEKEDKPKNESEIVTEDEIADDETIREEKENPTKAKPLSKNTKNKIPKTKKPAQTKPITQILQKLHNAFSTPKTPKDSTNQTPKSKFNQNPLRRPKSILKNRKRPRKSSHHDRRTSAYQETPRGLKSSRNPSQRSGVQTPAFAFGTGDRLNSTEDKDQSEGSGIVKREKNILNLLKRLGSKSKAVLPEGGQMELDDDMVKVWFQKVWGRIKEAKVEEEENGEYQRVKQEIIEKKQSNGKQIARINSIIFILIISFIAF